MATITSAGSGSGLDIEGLITKLMQAESQPLIQNQLKQTGLETEISAYGQLSSAIATFRTSVGALNRATDFKVFSSTSSNDKVVTAGTSISATPGTYGVEVVRLAENHKKIAATGYADSNTTKVGVNNDFITLTVGSSSFKVEFGGKTLDQIAQAINSASDNKGVTATVIKGDGATPYKLALTANNSGSGGFLQLAYSVDHFEFGSTAASTRTGSAYYADSGTTKIGRAGDTITLSLSGGGSSTVDIGDKTLTQIAAVINSAGDNPGITATVEQDATKGYYLKLTAGSNITTSYATTATLSSLFSFADINVDRATTTGGAGDGTFDSADLNAIVKVDGTTATRQSNSISDISTGVTFDLKGAGTATVTVTRDTSTITTRVQALVDAYNTFAEATDSLAEDELKNNTALRSVQTQIRNLLNTKADGLTYDYLTKIGVNFILENREMADGTTIKVSRLELDSSTLSSKLNSNFADVAALFSDEDVTTNGKVTHTGQGFGYRLDALLNNFVKTDGFLDVRVDGLGDQIERLESEEDDIQLRLDLLEKRYRDQFGALDILVANIRQTSDFLLQQLSSLPRIG